MKALSLGCGLLILVTSLSGCDQIPGTAEHRTRDLERLTADRMYDPEAVRFRDTRIRQAWMSDRPEPIWALCGEVNGKNRSGGYIGFRRFISDGATHFIDDPQITTTKSEYEAASATCLDPDLRTVSSCDEALDRLDEYSRQQTFEDQWDAVCVKPLSANRPTDNKG